ncbi:U6 snRNA-associated Sm-like protein LSm7 [Meyerozyma sp. JA9]|nr:U6 snRNA-associated Sm-like protein LSm7 [Meyerozyma sp. JA9]
MEESNQNQEKSHNQSHNHGQNTNQGPNQNQNRRRNNNSKHDGPKREAILDLNKYKDQKIRVKFIGGRQITGVLTGFDQLMNLVLEKVEETITAEDAPPKKRTFGRVVVRGTSLLTLGPFDGSEEIDNPFVQE